MAEGATPGPPTTARSRPALQPTVSRRRRDASIGYLVAAWLGAVALFGAVVAPAAFAALPSRALAGALVGRVLPVLFIAGMVVGLLVVVSARGVGARRLRAGRLIAGAVLLASCAVAQFVIGGRIERARAEAGGSLDQLAADHPIRVTFGRLHGLSVAGLAVAALSGAAALILLASAPDSRHSP